eukprot:scaffold45312_cov16-Tisochrysis_lutea.AAC.1
MHWLLNSGQTIGGSCMGVHSNNSTLKVLHPLSFVLYVVGKQGPQLPPKCACSCVAATCKPESLGACVTGQC